LAKETENYWHFFFVKMQWNEALNIELVDKNSQYTFMYVK
jgi:hypothetical protein